MNTQLTYGEVVHLLARSESDEFIQQVITLLVFAHEIMFRDAIDKQDFVFTLFDEGHVLITDIVNRRVAGTDVYKELTNQISGG